MGLARQNGFTLIEVTVALAIFALCVGALYEEFADALNRSDSARDREQGLLIAQSLLAQLRASPGPWAASSSGHSGDGWIWHEDVAPFRSGAEVRSAWQAFAVTVVVQRDGLDTRAVTLRSIELARTTP